MAAASRRSLISPKPAAAMWSMAASSSFRRGSAGAFVPLLVGGPERRPAGRSVDEHQD
jgi:hypothetical protein